MTIKAKLGREPTNDEVDRIKREALEDAAAAGKLSWQRKGRRARR